MLPGEQSLFGGGLRLGLGKLGACQLAVIRSHQATKPWPMWLAPLGKVDSKETENAEAMRLWLWVPAIIEGSLRCEVHQTSCERTHFDG